MFWCFGVVGCWLRSSWVFVIAGLGFVSLFMMLLLAV